MVRVLSMNDYNDKFQRISYSGDTDWRDIVTGTRDEMARTIAQNWVNDNDGFGEH